MRTRTDKLIGAASLLIVIVAIAFIVYALASPPSNEFARRDTIVQECIASERYTREECILLASGGNK